MKESKNHLDINLEFLDKKEPLRVAPKEAKSGQSSITQASAPTGHKYNWKNILIVGAVVLFFGWLISSGSGSSSPSSNSTYTPPATNSDSLAGNGKTYTCSDYNSNRADALRPDASVSAELDSRLNDIKAERAKIDAMYVDKTDQTSLDSYNAAVDDFNSKNDRYKSDLASFNQSIDTYNNFLDTNCSPQ